MNETNYTNTEEILLQLGAYLDTHSKRSFLNGSVVRTDDVKEFVKRALDQLAHDFEMANKIIRERETILSNAEVKAERMIETVEEQIQNMDISIAAKEWSENRVHEAELEYDRRMEELEIQTEEIIQRTNNSRKKVILDTHFYADEVFSQSSEELEKVHNAILGILNNVRSLQEANRANLEEKMHTIEEEQSEEHGLSPQTA